MRGIIIDKIKNVVFFLLFVNIISGQDVVTEQARKNIRVCDYCTCSEIPNEDATHLVLNIQCSELDRIENLPDLDKIEWPDNPNALKVSATFEGLGLSTLGKLPANSQVETLKFNNNAIKAYWPDPFTDVPNLRKLSFAQNDLTEITPDLFTNIPNLQDLDISYNKLTSFNPLDFKSLHNVKRLNLQSNLLKKIPVDALQPMKALEDLDLSKNGIYDLLLQKSDVDTLGTVKRLSLNGNRIRSVIKDSFPANNYLELLDLSNNIIEVVEEDAFLTCTNLKELNLGQNNITFIFSLPPSLQIFIVKQNTLRRWPKFPKGITYVDISYNKLSELYSKLYSSDFENLEVLNIAGNQLTELHFASKLSNLYSLDVSYNLLEEIPSSLNSQNFPKLEELRLDGNPITSIYFKEILAVKSLYMNELSKLLSVEDKAFSNVIGKAVEDSEPCFSLFLSNCHSLYEIHEGAFDGTSVCMLDISSNNLTHLSRSLLDWARVSEGVNLQWNPWDCGCHLQWFLDELLPRMYKTQSRLLAQLRCETPRAVQGLRLVHWYNWTGEVLCSEQFMNPGERGGYSLSPMTEREGNFLSNPSSLTLILGGCIIVALLVAIALSIYLVRGRRRYRVRQAALKRKRQSAIDARNSTGQQKEQYSALNKV